MPVTRYRQCLQNRSSSQMRLTNVAVCGVYNVGCRYTAGIVALRTRAGTIKGPLLLLSQSRCVCVLQLLVLQFGRIPYPLRRQHAYPSIIRPGDLVHHKGATHNQNIASGHTSPGCSHSARARDSKARWKSTSSGDAEPYAR